MTNAFTILSDFLDRHAGEVEGRGSEEPTPEIQDKLQAMARGGLSEPERNELVALLRDHPHWVGFLAEAIKAGRPEGGQDA